MPNNRVCKLNGHPPWSCHTYKWNWGTTTGMTTLWRVAPPKRYPKTKHCLARGHVVLLNSSLLLGGSLRPRQAAVAAEEDALELAVQGRLLDLGSPQRTARPHPQTSDLSDLSRNV